MNNLWISGFEIPKYWSFYIPSFQILTPTPKLIFVKLKIISKNRSSVYFSKLKKKKIKTL